jgi:hypothetical protein
VRIPEERQESDRGCVTSRLVEAWRPWLARLAATHGRLGDGYLLLTHPQPDVLARARAGLRALGVPYEATDAGIRISGQENIQALLDESAARGAASAERP